MRKFVFTILTFGIIICSLFSFGGNIASAEDALNISAKSAYLMDKRTGEMIYGKNENEHLPIASMVKIMTALLTFEEIEQGKLSFDEKITISENASHMGGSQMFLDKGLDYPITDLLKGVIVVSANDACVALAERIAGSEELFVQRMNERAKSLGMNDTIFVNSTGLPKEGQFSTAHDVAQMLAELSKHEHYYDYSKIWLEDYTHPDGRITTLTNTNKFVRFYDECDGGKTGFTSQARFCLAATATRKDTKLISVIIGADDSKTRFNESKKLLLYGFANYKSEIIARAGDTLTYAKVLKGNKREISCGVKEDFTVLLKANKKYDDVNFTFEVNDLKAPIKVGDVVGKCTVIYDEYCVEVPIIALEEVKEATVADEYKRIIEKWGSK